MEQVAYDGIVEHIIFQNKENGYCVFSMSLSEDEFEEIICVATILDLFEGEHIKVSGTEKIHAQYGSQLEVKSYEKVMPKTIHGIEKYLSSGVIKGIGPKTAKLIIQNFGEDAFEVIEKNPLALSKIRGISEVKALAIGKEFNEQVGLRNVMLFLQQYNISNTNSAKIYKKYKERTIDVVKTNPYILTDDIIGIGFKTADEIAEQMGIQRDSLYRIKSGIKYELQQNLANGNVYVVYDALLIALQQILRVDVEVIKNGIVELQLDGYISKREVKGVDVVYTSSYLVAENYVAKKLVELSLNVVDKSKDLDTDIDKVETELKIKLADMQRTAVKLAMQKGVLVITGGPGTGKTTIINTLIKLFEAEGNDVCLTAPTGRAAKRITETTGVDALTIHRLLGVDAGSLENRVQTFKKNEEEPIEADVVIVDESSMIDTMLMSNLLKAVQIGTRLILVGDVDQLPSVGAGNVLRDIIKSEVVTVVKLNEIFRQAKESAIVTNAHRINVGEYPEYESKTSDFFIMERNTQEEILSTVCDLVVNRLPNNMGFNSIEDIQVLSPIKKTQVGVLNLNQELQRLLNPESKHKNERAFKGGVLRVGDKVMQIKNNYDITYVVLDKNFKETESGVGIYNGEEGKVIKIDLVNEKVWILFEDRLVKYEYSQLDEIDLSYATTVHKSQGSEYKVVVMPVFSGVPMLMTRNLLYTAITRGKKLVILVGKRSSINGMIDNNREVERNSSLDYYLKRMEQKFDV